MEGHGPVVGLQLPEPLGGDRSTEGEADGRERPWGCSWPGRRPPLPCSCMSCMSCPHSGSAAEELHLESETKCTTISRLSTYFVNFEFASQVTFLDVEMRTQRILLSINNTT